MENANVTKPDQFHKWMEHGAISGHLELIPLIHGTIPLQRHILQNRTVAQDVVNDLKFLRMFTNVKKDEIEKEGDKHVSIYYGLWGEA